MRGTAAPITRDLVLIGGGHAHAAVLKSFGMRPEPGARVTMISRDALTPYSGMLPGLIAGHYTEAQAHIDLRPLCNFAGARLYHTAVTGIDLDRRVVLCDGRPPVPFDVLSIDIGSTPDTRGIEGAEHALAVKPVAAFRTGWEAIEARILASDDPFRVLVIGGGAGGVELCLSLQHRVRMLLSSRGRRADRVTFALASDAPALLTQHSAGVRERLTRTLARRDVALHLGAGVTALEPGRALSGPDKAIPFDAAVLTTHAAAPAWLKETGLALNEDGFIRVDGSLHSVSHEDVFAAGDVAAFIPAALPKSGVYAVRQGPILAANLRAALKDEPLRTYRPQARTLALISTGDRNAVASWGNVALEGPAIWRLKDWIDRRWMRGYQDLPAMPAEEAEDPIVAAAAMRCGGCGAKVPSETLRRVLDRLPRETRDSIRIGLDAADDAAVLAVPEGKLLVQSVDHFRPFIDDPYLFGRIVANHCLGDLHAMGAEPHSAQAQISLPFAEPSKMEDMLFQVMAGAMETLGKAGAVLIGGHTGEGAELSFGLTVNGFCDPAALTRKGGGQAGDVLILTKPLGTGVIFAAAMRHRAGNAAVETALAVMQQSNAEAAAIARQHGVHAATDVTGFGLLGHLSEMLTASGLGADLDLSTLPILPGALDLAGAGIVSSLHDGNRAFAQRIDDGAARHPAYPLLFDPQTAGGLLLSLPAEAGDTCLADLRAAGLADAAIIGRLRAADDGPAVRLASLA